MGSETQIGFKDFFQFMNDLKTEIKEMYKTSDVFVGIHMENEDCYVYVRYDKKCLRCPLTAEMNYDHILAFYRTTKFKPLKIK